MPLSNKEDVARLWEAGLPLSEAWFFLAREKAQSDWRNAANAGFGQSHQILMAADLCSRLGSGELIAIGFQTEPIVGGAPVRLPAHLFVSRPEYDFAASDQFRFAGIVFDHVRIAQTEANTSKPPRQPFTGSPRANADSDPASRRGGGRIGTYDKAAEVLTSLFAERPDRRHLSAERLHKAFAEEYGRRFPLNEGHEPAPAPRTLRNYLRRFRQESAGTGKNENAD